MPANPRVGSAIALNPTATDSSPRRERDVRLSWLVLLVPVAIVLLGAWNYRWVQEDAFIDFRIINNLLAGHGAVYNVGERVEVYSDPLWVFLLAGVHGVLPFISLEWTAVTLGLGFTASGVVLGGRATQQLGGSRGDAIVIPIGLFIFSVVAGVWEFSTSGLEMGMVFGWIGLSFWLIVRTERIRSDALRSAFVIGLGSLIRPELVFMVVVFLAALGVVVAGPGWKGPTSPVRRFVLPLLVGVGLPVAYEVWRMAYFALVVPNTDLAKSGTGSDWHQGFVYLWNFVAPYTLWLPILLVLPLVLPRLRRWWSAGDRTGVVVMVTPAVAAFADLLYVVHLGGDYMHARLLLPAFLALCVTLYIDLAQLRSLFVVLVAGIVVWCVLCGGWLRLASGVNVGLFGTFNGVNNERALWIYITGKAHPITLQDYARYTHFATTFRHDAAVAQHSNSQVMLILPPSPKNVSGEHAVPATSPLPFHLVVNFGNIGANGVVSGPQVYVFDTLSLANPIGAHTELRLRGEPGHEKLIGPAWMVARFGTVGGPLPPDAPSALSIEAAREALGCQPLRSYLHAITAPWTPQLAVSNILHALTFTTMSYSANPIIAARQLCH